MAFASDTRHTTFSLAERFENYRANLAAAASKRKLYRETYAELNSLGDRELADLGLHRSMIKSIALRAAYGG